MLSGAVNTAIVGSNGVLNRVSEDGVLTDWFRQPHRALRDLAPDHQPGRRAANRHDSYEPRRRDFSGEALRVWRDVELCYEGNRGAGAALYAPAGPRIPGAAQFSSIGEVEIPLGLGLITLTLLGIAVCQSLHEAGCDRIGNYLFRSCFFAVFEISESGYQKTQRMRGQGQAELDQFNLTQEAD